jgi:type IV pilus assembly protein PilB
MIKFEEDKQNQRIADLRKKEEEEVVQNLSVSTGIPYVDLTGISINPDALRLIEEVYARNAKVAAFALIDKTVKVAVRDPASPLVTDTLEVLKKKGYSIAPSLATTTGLEKAWATYKDLSFAIETKAGSLQIESGEISKIISEAQSLEQVQKILNEALVTKHSSRVSRILEIILAGAMTSSASDIHIEPEEDYIRLRYRLDGVLVNVLNFDRDTYNLLLSRIKLLSGLKLNIKKEPQDGRFSVNLVDTDIEIRTSVLPGAYSESIVLRILNPKSITTPLEELGIPPKLLTLLLKAIDRPDHMVLTTGPTGSGKTTTLYAFLRKVYSPELKVITIEDPIEYHLEGITQTQVNDKGYNFLEGLRSALRQDPDVIMVGEIRDKETAAIAINSSLTGHLVFSTLHTNNAAGTFPRLIDLGVNPKVITSAITVAIAQRLVRRLCPKCKKSAVLEGADLEITKKILTGILDQSQVPTEYSTIYKPVGCSACSNTGYSGRIGVYEAVFIDDAVRSKIEASASERDIAEAAKPQGILTMAELGILYVLSGTTSLEELQRVIELI